MFSLVVKLSLVEKDQDHLEIIIHNNSRVPDRTDAILNNGCSPVPEMVRSACLLSSCGADVIIVPCMTSHYFFPEVQSQTTVPMLNAIVETVRHLRETMPYMKKVGILATTGTIKSRLFQSELKRSRISSLVPTELDQSRFVMEAIYGPVGIKAGYCGGQSKISLLTCANRLIEQGAEAIIAGCTEIPLALDEAEIPVPLINPVKILATSAIRYCGREVRSGVSMVPLKLGAGG